MFNANWVQIAWSLIPWFLRQQILNLWIQSVLKPSVWNWDLFRAFRKAVLFKLRYSGQVVYLEHLLNAVFNNGLPAYTSGVPSGIYIGPGQVNYSPLFIYRKSEGLTDYNRIWAKSEGSPITSSRRIVLFRKSEIASFTWDFTVFVPNSLGAVGTHPNYNLFGLKIVSWVKLYAQAGKSFRIINYG